MEQDLTTWIELYLEEQIKFRRMGIRKAARIHTALVGPASGQWPVSVALVPFLKAQGIARPTLRHLDRTHIASYQDFLEHYVGLLRARSAIVAIRPFWQWLADNAFFLEPVDPPRLSGLDDALPSHRITVRLSRRLS